MPEIGRESSALIENKVIINYTLARPIRSLNFQELHLKYGENFTYNRYQVFKNRELRWEYKGILHEYPNCINKKNPSTVKITGDYYID
ncbi:MAG: hypothetical protein EBS34_04800, partial [Flavobacteriales bacterium]|nr:hypothetical protein [Flavobacteriales bacterium]